MTQVRWSIFERIKPSPLHPVIERREERGWRESVHSSDIFTQRAVGVVRVWIFSDVGYETRGISANGGDNIHGPLGHREAKLGQRNATPRPDVTEALPLLAPCTPFTNDIRKICFFPHKTRPQFIGIPNIKLHPLSPIHCIFSSSWINKSLSKQIHVLHYSRPNINSQLICFSPSFFQLIPEKIENSNLSDVRIYPPPEELATGFYLNCTRYLLTGFIDTINSSNFYSPNFQGVHLSLTFLSPGKWLRSSE